MSYGWIGSSENSKTCNKELDADAVSCIKNFGGQVSNRSRRYEKDTLNVSDQFFNYLVKVRILPFIGSGGRP